MADNSLITAVALVDRLIPQLNADKRDQLSRNTLQSVQRTLGQVTSMLQKVQLENDMSNYYFADVSQVISTLLEDSDFQYTDTQTKTMIVSSIMNGLDILYIEAGKYYDTEHEFEYSFRMNDILKKIVDACIERGYYFGQEA